jgi:predicted DsbA family dithiol-disulfide isomerase
VRVEQLRREFPLDVEWRPFELRPGTPPEGIPMERIVGRGRYTPDYFEYLRQTAAEAGIRLAERTLFPNSRPSLEAAEFAREAGAFEPFHRALFAAYFEHDRNIGDTMVLRELAESCGMDGAALIEALESRRYASVVDEGVSWAHSLGVGGIPTFIFYAEGASASGGEDRFVMIGGQEYPVFRSLAERVLLLRADAQLATAPDTTGESG